MRTTPKQRGFTLVEVVVATVLLTIGLLGALTAFSMASRVTGAATNDTMVTFLAQQKLAELGVSNWWDLRPGVTTGDFGPEYPDYLWRLTVRPPTSQHVFPVDLIIYAPEAGRTREIRFTTMVF
jgi:prepilin-type N-terminal cleavage/methylation domain-containing protein